MDKPDTIAREARDGVIDARWAVDRALLVLPAGEERTPHGAEVIDLDSTGEDGDYGVDDSLADGLGPGNIGSAEDCPAAGFFSGETLDQLFGEGPRRAS